MDNEDFLEFYVTIPKDDTTLGYHHYILSEYINLHPQEYIHIPYEKIKNCEIQSIIDLSKCKGFSLTAKKNERYYSLIYIKDNIVNNDTFDKFLNNRLETIVGYSNGIYKDLIRKFTHDNTAKIKSKK